MAPELTLYYTPTCYFCRKVTDHLQGRDLKIPMRDIVADPSARDELVKITGKGQVPCLVINGEPLLESDSIVAWLDEHL